MAEAHGTHEDPNTAPMHHDLKERFAAGQVVLAYAAGIAAVAVGLILGIVLANN